MLFVKDENIFKNQDLQDLMKVFEDHLTKIHKRNNVIFSTNYMIHNGTIYAYANSIPGKRKPLEHQITLEIKYHPESQEVNTEFYVDTEDLEITEDLIGLSDSLFHSLDLNRVTILNDNGYNSKNMLHLALLGYNSDTLNENKITRIKYRIKD